jgi:hypothetical protein
MKVKTKVKAGSAAGGGDGGFVPLPVSGPTVECDPSQIQIQCPPPVKPIIGLFGF